MEAGKFGSEIMQDVAGYLPYEELLKIYKVIPNERDKILFRLLIRNGRRVSEVVGRARAINAKVPHTIREEYVDPNTGMITKTKKTVIIQKTYPPFKGITPRDISKERPTIVFPILKKRKPTRKLKRVDQKTLDMLRDYIKKYNIGLDDNIFNISRQQVFKLFRKYCEIAGIYKIGNKSPHPHHLRHSYAINRLNQSNNPADLRKIQLHLDHTSLEMTSNYLRYNTDDQASIIDAPFGKKDKNINKEEKVKEE